MILPVKQNDQYGGWAQLSGLLRVERDALVIEYSLKDEVLGVFNSDLKILKISHSAIEEIVVQKKWFSAKFDIYLNRLPKTAKSISIKENCISFTIKKKEMDRALSIKSRLMLKISEEKLRRIEDEEDQTGEEASFEFYSKKTKNDDSGSGDKENGFKNMLRKTDE